MTGVGRPDVIADAYPDGGSYGMKRSGQGSTEGSVTLSRKALIAQGAPALADMLMRACLHYPALAADLAKLAPEKAVDARERPRPAVPGGAPGESFMVGDCPAMQAVFKAIRRFATVDAPVLVTGESGTGKELAARAIHERSAFARGPFVAVNCAGLPPSLIASELFGHEKGAFTGAVARRVGRIEEAQGGTLFLDEIGDLPHELQANLLRFLQDGTIERVGSNKPVRIETRVIAATNVDLETAVADGAFRQDLFFRLDVLRVHMPALRDRGGDLELLVRYFLGEAMRKFDPGATPAIAADCLAALVAYDWPGNVRELISKIRRAVVMAGDRPLARADFDLNGPSAQGAQHPSAPRHAAHARPAAAAKRLCDARALAEREAVEAALENHHFNVTRAARELGVSRVTIYKLMDRYGIQR